MSSNMFSSIVTSEYYFKFGNVANSAIKSLASRNNINWLEIIDWIGLQRNLKGYKMKRKSHFLYTMDVH